MKYEDLSPITPDQLERALAGKSPEDAGVALLRMALNDPNWAWAEEKRLAALHDGREPVRAAAITSLGHLARIHRKVTKETVVPELQKFKGHPESGALRRMLWKIS
jgi:hypothetical protein